MIGLGVLFSQWAIFYHCIFNVEFLGWDLMEPITYSLSQGTFVAWILYQSKTGNAANYSDFYKRGVTKRTTKLAKEKFGVDISRIEFLRRAKDQKEEQIRKLKDLSTNYFDFN